MECDEIPTDRRQHLAIERFSLPTSGCDRANLFRELAAVCGKEI